MGNRSLVLLVIALACDTPGDGDSCPPTITPVFCPVPPLAATDPHGQPWPSYSAVSAAVADCTQYEEYQIRQQGRCSDGKQFVSKNGGLSGEYLYFRGETVVGFHPWSDLIGIVCNACTPPSGRGDIACDVIEQTETRCPPDADAGIVQ